MGNCGGTTVDSKTNDEIDKAINNEKRGIVPEIKILLLGAGESGKSTIAKQIRILHLNGYTESDRQVFKSVVYSNIVHCMRALVKGAEQLNIATVCPESIAFINQPAFDMAQGELTAEVVNHVKKVWADAGIKAAWDKHSEFQIFDCAEYMFDNLDRISAPDYIPTVTDIIMSRTKTTGVSEIKFQVGDNQFRLVDVGGQRSERKKWIKFFIDVNAVLFVVAASEYDQKLYEDNETNRMAESMKLFKEICNNPAFASSAMILFFNKSDLFQQKIKKSDLAATFPDYTGGANYEAACSFLQEKFQCLNENPKKALYVHFTNATSTENVNLVFNSVRDAILREIMQSGNPV